MAERYEQKEWREKMGIKLDVNNMFEPAIDREQALSREEVNDIKPEIKDIHNKIKQKRDQGKMEFMELPYQEQETLENIIELAQKKQDEIENFVILGIGGSALGSIALKTALKDAYHNTRGQTPRLFVPDNVDPERLESLIEMLDLDKTIFNVISKSGGTAETMSEFLIAREAVVDELGEDSLSEHFIATTSADSGYLIKIADKENLPTFHIPENVGGRFSVLTPVGLVFAAFAGMDIRELLAGAAYMDQRCQTTSIWDNPAYLNAVLHYLGYEQGKKMSVMMPYAHSLKDLADWYRQLLAESLGKELDRQENIVNVGPTPIKALGATDQHSQCQLYMEGPYDKIVTFVEVENYRTEVEIPGAYPEIDGVSYLGGHTLNKLIKTEKKATELALTRRNRLNESIIIPEINEFTLGQFFYMMELQIAVMGEMFNINAFNQPGVELGKHYTYGVLGRDGYADMKEEYDNRPDKDNDLIV